SRIAREFHIGGPSHGIASEETSGLRALQVAVHALQKNELDVALAGAVDLNGDLRALLTTDAPGIPGEGAACVVLKRLGDAKRDGDRIYAVIRDPAASAPAEAIAGAETDIGHTGAASGMFSFVKASLCLHHEVLPDGKAPRYWVRDRADGPRRARVTSSGVAGDRIEMVLEGVEEERARSARPFAKPELKQIQDSSPGRIAFVFPGSGNQFADMGRELALQWPEILRRQDAEN